jgi:predicted O-methyltransferase YrrM
MPESWTAERVMELARNYQEACVLAAAVDLDVFTRLAERASTAEELAAGVGSDLRATRFLLDALAALTLLEKTGQRYRVPDQLAPFVISGSACSVLPMLQHQANCMRRWVQLPWVVKSGRPAERSGSLRGAEADRAAFLEAMNCVSAPLLTELITALQPLRFSHLLDVGGATGTWTVAFLRAVPDATATIFDLPDALPLAKRRLLTEGLSKRAHLVGGDFYEDPLPKGADLAWLGAIIHQNSRAQNRELFAKVYDALAPGGHVVIRDIVMEPTHTRPVTGALFAINMLVATEGGGTFSLDEISEDLSAAGFTDITLVRHGKRMDSLVRAVKPSQLPPE